MSDYIGWIGLIGEFFQELIKEHYPTPNEDFGHEGYYHYQNGVISKRGIAEYLAYK